MVLLDHLHQLQDYGHLHLGHGLSQGCPRIWTALIGDQDPNEWLAKSEAALAAAKGEDPPDEPHQVINPELPKNDHRPNTKFDRKETKTIISNYPGGDVMTQGMWKKMLKYARMGNLAPPKEEDWYGGARLGEYARPLIMGPEEVGYLPMAPVPFSSSEDLLAQIAQSGVQARTARHAALYAKTAVKQAEEFFHLARRRARQIFRPPLLTVMPGGDVFPNYSACSPAWLALAPPPSWTQGQRCCRCRRRVWHRGRSPNRCCDHSSARNWRVARHDEHAAQGVEAFL
mmetsp:Transcript_616/g.1044  ORF Transcript_616/g.1044 Transcript_616/m.1044 type:complete len:286 (-) Transcript_616:2-859(-)